jgi:nitrate/nitrite-specific signal transduction histidine kinase
MEPIAFLTSTFPALDAAFPLTRLGAEVLLDAMFDNMPMGICIYDTQMRICRYNETWEGYLRKYSPRTAPQLSLGACITDLLPGSEGQALTLFSFVLGGNTLQRKAAPFVIDGHTSYWDSVFRPLRVNGDIVGILHVTVDVTNKVVTEQHIREQEQQSRRDQAQLNQQLEGMVAQRTLELSTLLDISHHLVSVLNMEALIAMILEQLQSVVAYDGAAILIVDNGTWKTLACRGAEGHAQAAGSAPVAIPMPRLIHEVIASRHVACVDDVDDHSPLSVALGELLRSACTSERSEAAHDAASPTDDAWPFCNVRSWVGVPLWVGTRMIGMLSIAHHQPRFYSAHLSGIVLAFANHAAIAIENARLYEQARQLAALEERQRLARDLHDAVTQTLFSSSLIADVLPDLWEKNPDKARQRLAQLQQLTRSALTEMRTLLLELRPRGLYETDIADLLQQLIETLRSRTKMTITLSVSLCKPLPQEVQVVLYRIAQEALNNVVRHARAAHADVKLLCNDHCITLSIHDDGCGFIPAVVVGDHLGLNIMRERAGSIAAHLRVDSTPGMGTSVLVTWSKEVTHER